MLRRLLLLAALFAITARSDDSPAEALKTALNQIARPDLPGAAVLIARDGKILYQGGFGAADIETKTPITPETKFRIGSITKQFTAAAILKLQDAGKLSVTDKLEKYFPGVANGKEITLHHLLTHSSGVHSYTDEPDFMSTVREPVPPADLIAKIRTFSADFAPGKGFHYSNSGYFLLGEIVAQVSGQSFANYLRTTFFEPLGMKDTGIFDNARPPEHVARGYMVAEGKAALAIDWDMSRAGGAGALYSTVGDLFRWNEALYGGRILSTESLTAMTTANPLPPGVDGLHYGYGLSRSTIQGLPVITHSGGLQGWSSDMLWAPGQHFTAVALTNAMPGLPKLNPGYIIADATGLFLAAEIAKLPKPTEDKTVDPAKYPDYVGDYDYISGINTITTKDGHLFAQLTGQARFEIFPEGPDAFFWKVADAHIRFLRDNTGKVIAAEHTQNGSTFRAAQVKPPAVTLTPAELDTFKGKYRYAESVTLTVRRQGKQLLAQLTGQPEFPIYALTADTFEWRVVPAQVRFVKDDTGKVTKAIHTQSGQTLEAPRLEP